MIKNKLESAHNTKESEHLLVWEHIQKIEPMKNTDINSSHLKAEWSWCLGKYGENEISTYSQTIGSIEEMVKYGLYNQLIKLSPEKTSGWINLIMFSQCLNIHTHFACLYLNA